MMNKMIKKALITLSAAAILFGACTVSPANVFANDGMGVDSMNVSVSEYSATEYVTVSSANVRVAPSTDSRILKSLSKGTSVQVDGITSNGWVQIWTSDPVYGGYTCGYIAANLLSENTSAKEYTTQVADGYLALRSAAGYDYKNEIGALYNGSVVKVTGEKSGDYVKVTVVKCVQGALSTGDLTGKTGYVNANYLK